MTISLYFVSKRSKSRASIPSFKLEGKAIDAVDSEDLPSFEGLD
jgi:hypothetical protein